jgi:NitT/TauT family transport system permease protein
VARIAKPYVVAIGAVPVFALAPVMIVWFGIGIFSKIMIAALSTVIVAIVQAYEGATSVDTRHLQLLQVMGATRYQTFRKVVVPSALIWVVNSMKLNVGFALLGAFIGEFISSEQGLGYLVLKAAGLYDMSKVFAGCLAIMAIALMLNWIVGRLEARLFAWREAQ